MWLSTFPQSLTGPANLLVPFTAFISGIMPQVVTFVNLRTRISCGIIPPMPTSPLTLDALPPAFASQIISASSLTLNLPQPPKNFFRHGWQSWSLAAWLDPSEPPLPIRSPEFRAKDEDAAYALHPHHISAWAGAVELGADDILLLGALGLGGRIEINGTTLKGFYESAVQDGSLHDEWLLARGTETQVFSKYAELQMDSRTRPAENPPRTWRPAFRGFPN
jgi:hypothetical protein